MNPVAHSLALALIDDPFYRRISDSAPDEASRVEMLESYFQLAMNEAQAIGEVQLAAPDGAALWLTNEAAPQEIALHSDKRRHALQSLLGPEGFRSFSDMCDAMEQQLPNDLSDAWYLSILGVHPDARGKGVAQRLLEHTLQRADSHKKVCFLETFNPLSLPFYNRVGFEVRLENTEPVTGRPYWLMARNPNPSLG